MDLFTKLLQPKHDLNSPIARADVEMAPKKAASRKPGGKTGGAAASSALQGASASHSVVCSPAASSAAATEDSPQVAPSPMADKEKHQPPPSAMRTLAEVLDQSAEGLDVGGSASWAHLSTGRGAVRKIALLPETAGPASNKGAVTAQVKLPGAVSRKGKLAVSQAVSAMPTADDQQTQDDDGQAAAPQLRFEVSTQYVAWQPPFRVGCMQP